MEKNEQLNFIGYSTGSVILAQAALMIASEETPIGYLVLIGSPIKEDSKLYQGLLDNPNIHKVIRIDIDR